VVLILFHVDHLLLECLTQLHLYLDCCLLRQLLHLHHRVDQNSFEQILIDPDRLVFVHQSSHPVQRNFAAVTVLVEFRCVQGVQGSD
jgi:hypothetical protein